KISARRAAGHAALVGNRIALYGMGRERCVSLLVARAAVHARAGRRQRDGQKWLALVIERRSNRALKEAIERDEILCGCGRAEPPIKLQEITLGGKRAFVSLVVIDGLKDFADFKLLGNCFALVRGHLR